jgi:hypothetical protein
VMETAWIIEILSLATKYGIPAVLKIIETWDSSTPITQEDIDNLKSMIKRPEDYT